MTVDAADVPAARKASPRLGRGTAAFVLTILAAAFAAYTVSSLVELRPLANWEPAVLLAVAAAVAQLFVVVTPLNQSYHLTPGLVVAAAILLPPPLVALVVVVQHVPEWIRARYPWFIQTFNIANYALSAFAAALSFDAVRAVPADRLGNENVRYFVAGVAAAGVFVLLQHLLLALVLLLARGHSFRASGLFTVRSLSMDLVLAVLGVVVAYLWGTSPLLIVLALSPLFLLHRTLALPTLEAEARQDTKTELYNARHFTEALGEAIERAQRLDLPLALLVADLDLLREINNRYGHLAGDDVLAGVARVFKKHVRPGDVAARFGGEEFCILLLDTSEAEAAAIAERIRGAVETTAIEVDTAAELVTATVSIGVAAFPQHATGARELLHRADVAAYRAKAHGRNRVVVYGAALELSLPSQDHPARSSGATDTAPISSTGPARQASPAPARLSAAPALPNQLAPAPSVRAFVSAVAVLGLGVGTLGFVLGESADLASMLVFAGVIALGEAFAADVLDRGTISLSAVGSLAGAALIGPRAALPLAIVVCLIDWLRRRTSPVKVMFNGAVLTLSGLAGALVYGLLPATLWAFTLLGALAGIVYYAVNIGLLTTVIAIETRERWLKVLRARFEWLLAYYALYGVVGATFAVAYTFEGALGLLVFSTPLLLVRKAQSDYLRHTESTTTKLRRAATTIESQNETLLQANTLLRERATAAMESLAAAVDARDGYTAGHSRRVQAIACAVAQELGLSAKELEAVSYAALFHDVGKLGVPDAILLKPGPLEERDWSTIRHHPDEGARIIAHLGFLADATPAIRHHHERFDGTGYPDGLRGDEIPIGARIVHISDALDSMLSSRVYRSALPLEQALIELGRGSGTQFCPACEGAVRRVIASGALDGVLASYESDLAA